MVRGMCGLKWTGVDCGERCVWSDVDRCGLW